MYSYTRVHASIKYYLSNMNELRTRAELKKCSRKPSKTQNRPSLANEMRLVKADGRYLTSTRGGCKKGEMQLYSFTAAYSAPRNAIPIPHFPFKKKTQCRIPNVLPE